MPRYRWQRPRPWYMDPYESANLTKKKQAKKKRSHGNRYSLSEALSLTMDYLSQSTWDDGIDDDELLSLDLPIATTQTGTNDVFLGTVYGHIVGLQYYSGDVNNNEMVSLVREPTNKYDRNAVKVENVWGEQVGHIKRELAEVLSYIVDNNYARIEGVVPSGKNNVFRMPVDISLYGPACNATTVLQKLRSRGFSASTVEKRAGFTNTPSSGKSKKSSTYNPRSALGKSVVLSENEMKNEVDTLFDNLKSLDKTSEQEPNKCIVSMLYPHQKQALNWMLARENNDQLPTFWEKTPSGLYHNSLTNFSSPKRPESVCGGILADEMGLGKTLSVIALIMHHFVIPDFVDDAPALPSLAEEVNITGPSTSYASLNGPSICSVTITVPQNHVTSQVTQKVEAEAVKISQELPVIVEEVVGVPQKGVEDEDIKFSQELPVVHEEVVGVPQEVIVIEDNCTPKEESSMIKDDIQRSTKQSPIVIEDDVESSTNDASSVKEAAKPPVPVHAVTALGRPKRASAAKVKFIFNDDSDDNPSPEKKPKKKEPKVAKASKVKGQSKVKGKGKGKKKLEVDEPQPGSSSQVTSGPVPTIASVPTPSTNSSVTSPSGPSPGLNTPSNAIAVIAGHVKTIAPFPVSTKPITSVPGPNKPLTFVPGPNKLVSMAPGPSKLVPSVQGPSKLVPTVPAPSKLVPSVPGPSKSVPSVAGPSTLSIAEGKGHIGEGDAKKRQTTLIICPLSVLSNWIDQFGEHVSDEAQVNVCLYYGAEKKKLKAKQLQEQDVVITTYNTMAAEYKASKEKATLQKIEWHRIVLDEAHTIRNHGTLQTQAAHALKAKCKWALTGTPIQNSIKDLWSLVAFLGVEPFKSTHNWWQRIIARPIANNNSLGIERVRKLMDTLALRRMKSQKVNGKPLVDLPARNVVLQYVDFSKDEKDVYKTMEKDGRLAVSKYFQQGTVLDHYGDILAILMRLRQLCCHPGLCAKAAAKLSHAMDNNEKTDEEKAQLVATLVSFLSQGADEECCICLESIEEPVITRCAHVFCQRCIGEVIMTEKELARCPLCRNPVSKEALVHVPKDKSDTENSDIEGEWHSSAKVDALMECLLKQREADKTTKSVVVSQFTSFLDLLKKPLTEKGFKFGRLDGSMSNTARTAAIRDFSSDDPDSPQVFLLSLKAGGVGLNLTAASRLYLLDPAWNPACEEQCFDRCHRLGQTKDVTITKFLVRDSVEEAMLQLQETKRQLMSRVFDGKKQTAEERRQNRVRDIKILMGMNNNATQR